MYHNLHIISLWQIFWNSLFIWKLFPLIIPKINIDTSILFMSYHSTFSTFIQSLLAIQGICWVWLDIIASFPLKDTVRSHLKYLRFLLSLTLTLLSSVTLMGSTSTSDIFLSVSSSFDLGSVTLSFSLASYSPFLSEALRPLRQKMGLLDLSSGKELLLLGQNNMINRKSIVTLNPYAGC